MKENLKIKQESAKPQDGEKAEYLPSQRRIHSAWLGMVIFLCLLGFASFALPTSPISTAMPLLLLSLFCVLLALFIQPPAANMVPRSSGGWLGLSVVLFVIGLVVCGNGSAAVLFLATLSTLPAVLGRRHPGQRTFGVVLLCISLFAGISLYSKQGWGPYNDYLQRAKVAEALSLLGRLKPRVEQWYKDKKWCPSTLELSAQIHDQYTERIVLTRADTRQCVYTAILKTKAGFSKNATIGLAYLIEQRTWSCKDRDTGTTKLSPLYLPYGCREEN